MKKFLLVFLLVLTTGCFNNDEYLNNVDFVKEKIDSLNLTDKSKEYYNNELTKLYDDKKDTDIAKFKEETTDIYRQAHDYGANYKQILDKIWIKKFVMTNITGYDNDGQDGFLLSTIKNVAPDNYLAQGDGRIFGSFQNENMTWTLAYNGALTIKYAKSNKIYLQASSYEVVDNKYIVLKVTKFKNKKVNEEKQFRLSDNGEFDLKDEESFIK